MMNKKKRFSFLIKERYHLIIYTLKHKGAFLKTERQIRKKNTFSGYLHDVDKIFLYLALWIELKTIQRIHQSYSKHHLNNKLKKTNKDYINTLIDWECARFTKPDKPLNAYQTLMTLYPNYIDIFLPLIKEYLPDQIPNESKNKE